MISDFDYLNEELDVINTSTTPQELKAILQSPSKNFAALRSFAAARRGGPQNRVYQVLADQLGPNSRKKNGLLKKPKADMIFKKINEITDPQDRATAMKIFTRIPGHDVALARGRIQEEAKGQ